MSGKIKLHIGGQTPKEGWSILDVRPGPGVDYVGNCVDLSFLGDESCAEVYASHVLEHLSYDGELLRAMKEIYRVLVPGGRLRVSVPDLAVLCRLFSAPGVTLKQRYHIMRMIFGGQVDPHDFHFTGLWPDFLASLFREVGFSTFETAGSFGEFKDGSDVTYNGERISLNMEAYK
jgi:predicted SAM-dependent methyltransferase